MKLADDKICGKCTTGSVEDEKHFLLVCPKFNTIRIAYPHLTVPHFAHDHVIDNILAFNNICQFYEVVNFIRDTKVLN